LVEPARTQFGFMRMELLRVTRIFRRLGLLALIIKAGLPANAALRAGLVLDAANYLRTFELEGPPPYYTGPPNPGLDFLSANLIHVRYGTHDLRSD